jgi:hypothetical protein
MAQIGSIQPGVMTTTCGYPIASGGVPMYILPQGSDAWAQVNGVVLSMGGVGNANCGRCVQITRTKSGTTRRPWSSRRRRMRDRRLPGRCEPALRIGQSTYLMLATANEPSFRQRQRDADLHLRPLPGVGQPDDPRQLQDPGRSPPTSVLFLQHRYGIASVTMDDPTPDNR